MIEPKTFDIKTHIVTIYEDFVSIRPKSNNHLLIIGEPDSSIEPNRFFETSVYIGNHASLLINGFHKELIQLCLQSSEFPTQLSFDESEGKFERKSTYEILSKLKTEDSK